MIHQHLVAARAGRKPISKPCLLGATLAILVITSFVAMAGQTTESASGKTRMAGLASIPALSSGTPLITGPLQYLAPIYSEGGALLENPSPLAIADVNNDGKLDVAEIGVGTPSSVSLMLGNGDGTFQTPSSISTGLSLAEFVTMADVNGDGNTDLIVVGCNSGSCYASVLLGNGDGTFKTPALFGAGTGQFSAVAVADVNGDGKPDVLILNACTGQPSCSGLGSVGVLLGKGDGTFAPLVTSSTGAYESSRLAVADLNGDGKADVVVGNECGNSCSTFDQSHELTVLISKGDGTFKAPVAYATGNFLTDALTLSDLNDDGKLDLAVVSNCPSIPCGSGNNPVSVLLGNGDGTFQTATSYDGGGFPLAYIVATDANGDGKADLVMSGFCNENSVDCGGTSAALFTLQGNGDGTFKPAAILEIVGDYGGPDALSVADLNDDGKPDLVVAHGCSLVSCPVNNLEVGAFLNNHGAPATATTVASSKNPAPLFARVTYTATVSGGSGGTIDGSVTFADGDLPVATVTLSGNAGSYSTTYRSAGTHSLTATYSGTLHTDSASRSAALTETVVNPTTTTLKTSGSPTFVGQPVTFTATVTSKYGAIPNGELVKFYDGSTLLASVALSSGTATYTTSSLTAKSHGMKAVYGGDSTFATSTGFVTQVVEHYSTTTTLTCNPNPSNVGQAVTMTATVKSAGPVTPTGKVVFFDGTTRIGSATLSGGAGTITLSKLASGTHPITATYDGDSNSATSTSAVVNQVVH